MRFLDNVLQDYIDRAPDEMARASYSRRARAHVGLGVMGFHSFLQARSIPFEGAMAKIVEHARSSSISAPRPTRRSLMLAKERGPCPDAADHGRDGALQLQDGDRADRVDLDHLRRHLGLHRADPGQHLHPQDAVGLVLDQEPASRAAADRQVEEHRRRLVHDPRARRLGPAPRFPHARGKGRVQDQLRDRPALADRARRRPHALYRPGASR